MLQKRVFLVLLFYLVFNIGFSQEGKLSKAKESLKAEKSSVTTTKNSRRSTIKNDNEELSFGSLFAGFFIKIFAYTAYGIAFETPWEIGGKMHNAEIAIYPYKKPRYGNFIYTDSTNFNLVRLDVYNHFLKENKNLFGNDLGANFRFLKRFSIEANYVKFFENVNGKRDNFSVFNSLLKYHRIRTQSLDAWFGLGITHVGSNVNETKFLIGFGGELFVKKPVSLLVSHKWAKVNNESINNTKLLLKYHIKNYRISTGYQHYKLGVSKINAFSIGVETSF